MAMRAQVTRVLLHLHSLPQQMRLFSLDPDKKVEDLARLSEATSNLVGQLLAQHPKLLRGFWYKGLDLAEAGNVAVMVSSVLLEMNGLN
jgi:hypothetical protein